MDKIYLLYYFYYLLAVGVRVRVQVQVQQMKQTHSRRPSCGWRRREESLKLRLTQTNLEGLRHIQTHSTKLKQTETDSDRNGLFQIQIQKQIVSGSDSQHLIPTALPRRGSADSIYERSAGLIG